MAENPRKRGRGKKNGSQYQEKTQIQDPPEKELSTEELPPQKGQDKKGRNVNPEELGMQFKRKLAFAKFPERPGYGTLGKRIRLISNCFSLKVPSGSVYHYDVTVTKKQSHNNVSEESSALQLATEEDNKKYRCLSTKRNRQVIKLMMETNRVFHNVYSVYDGRKNIYTRTPLNANFPINCEVVIPNEDDHNPDDPKQDLYMVQTKPALREDGTCAISLDLLHAFYEKRISSVPQESIMALETILREGPCLQFTPIGRSFFFPPSPQNLNPLGGGLEIWFGYHQSVRLGQWGPMVNLNRTATAFYQKCSVLNFISETLHMSVSDLRRRACLPAIDIKRITSKLKNIKIEVTHLRNYRRRYRVVKLTKESANRLEFELTENGRVVKKTVAAYFRERYGRNLEFPNLPCLQVQPEKKKTYIPIEVCEILEGQHSKKKLDAMQTSQMIKFTAAPPKERFAEIKQIVENPDYNNIHVQQFGVQVSREPMKLTGRVLDSPMVRYKDGDIQPVDGAWNMRQKKFFSGAQINSWVVLNFAYNVKNEHLKNLSEMIIKISRGGGIMIDAPKAIHSIDPSKCDIKKLLYDMKNTHGAELALIVLPVHDKLIYGKIKQTAETVIGLRTQCIKETNVTNPKKFNAQLISNICLKINAKTGGENNILILKEIPILTKPVIIIGADVNHPGISEGMKTSLAACVCNLDNRLAKYAVSIRAQQNIDEKKQAVEIINELKAMILELLMAFYKHTNGKKPEKIILYRDGVSEGQFDKIQDHEVKCIREACRTLPGQYEPGITFIVVQKRHHMRFIPEDYKDGAGSPRNIPPGTTIDTVVTDPLKFDFFLCSHLGLKGTSRPSHYTVLEDDNKFSADELQKMTYQLCHTYARCTRSISIPVPVAYADLAAYRARQHLEASLEETTASSDSSGGSDSSPLPQAMMDSIRVAAGFDKAMYFV